MNKVVLLGRVASDYTKFNGGISFRFAVPRNKEKTDFLTLKAFNKTAELIENNIEKGDQCCLSGRIEVDEYNEKYYTNIIVNDVSFCQNRRK